MNGIYGVTLVGMTRVRNESEIIKNTLDYYAGTCTGGIYVYDDFSSDDTVEICRGHPAVRTVIEGRSWDPDRERAEYQNRSAVLQGGADGGRTGLLVRLFRRRRENRVRMGRTCPTATRRAGCEDEAFRLLHNA